MILNNHPSKKEITIVTGLPRSGTSMMMKMLTTGGMEALVDNIRNPDQDNPKGYFEYERVKNLPAGDVNWLENAIGKVVKIVAFFLPHLPSIYHYQIIFMNRPLPEILASQIAMLTNRENQPAKVDTELMIGIYEKHLQQVNGWIEGQVNVERVDIDHHELIFNPLPQIIRINEFLGGWLDIGRMQNAIDPDLYRQRQK